MRLKVVIRGAVQGVGFRPHIFRLAEAMCLSGWVNNSPQGVLIEAEGSRTSLERFLLRLQAEKPGPSRIASVEPTWLDPAGYAGFQIRESVAVGEKSVLVMPDLATCEDCRQEILDPANRRFRYPFANCTHCGPRFSIIEAVPYDRVNTTMKGFALCPACDSEYHNPRDRRFHAQPNACPVCGPHLELWSEDGTALFGGDPALLAAAQLLRRGKIVAVKGIGGFHLLVDATNEIAVRRLRERKCREEKPFALLFPTLAHIQKVCEVSPLEEQLLTSREAPIVLLRKLVDSLSPMADSVAPGNPWLGAMLPANPLHHLLLLDLGFPVVATSGNRGEEPICTKERDVREQLGGIADAFLVHDRPIARHVDDSIVRVMADRPMIIRRARGYAPLPIRLDSPFAPAHPAIVLAVGAHQKNTLALALGDNVFLSQHIGDLSTVPAHQAFMRVVAELPRFHAVTPQVIATDLHPDYLSTRYAQASGRQTFTVQHHIAHVLSCIAENNISLPALGVAWDGTGLGLDGTIWGGEFFLVTDHRIERVAHLRPFRLPGGDRAALEPRRSALGLLFELFGEAAWDRRDLAPFASLTAPEWAVLQQMLQRKLNSPVCSSMGRFFDAVASLLDLRQKSAFEGQSAMALEFAREGMATEERYDFAMAADQSPLVLDWSPVIIDLLADRQHGLPIALQSAKVHNALAAAIVRVARHLDQTRVALSGGCFQNRYLLESTVAQLRRAKIQPHWQQQVPTNDGGIALGQVLGAQRMLHGL